MPTMEPMEKLRMVGGAHQEQRSSRWRGRERRQPVGVAHRGAEIPGEDALHIGEKLGADGAVHESRRWWGSAAVASFGAGPANMTGEGSPAWRSG